MRVRNIISAFTAAATEVAEGLFTRVQAFCDVVGNSPATEAILKAFGKVIHVVRINNNPQTSNRHDHMAGFGGVFETAVPAG